jgi:hypothetical protein
LGWLNTSGVKIMKTWLKLIGSGKEPITGYPYYGKYDSGLVGFRKTRKPSVRLGDHLFLYAPGGSKRIFALAEVTSDPEYYSAYDPQEEGSTFWVVNVRYLIKLAVESGIHIDEITTSRRKLLKSIQRQSHIELFPEESELAYTKLQKKATS